MLTVLALAALAACGPTCGGQTTSSHTTHSPSGSTSGTYPEDITITGFFSGHIGTAFASCVQPGGGFQGFVQDSKAGSPLRFDFNIPAAAFRGAGTYGPADGNVLGTVYMAGQVTWTAKSGTFTISPGEKAGSIQMHLEAGPSFKAEDISGSWRCG